MEHTIASSLATSLSSPPASDTSPVIPALNLVAITQKELTRLKWEGGYWKAQYQRAIEREARLKKEIEQKKALICDLQHRLFGKKSETSTASEGRKGSPAPPVKRPRGQQKGSPGHGRTPRPDLPVIEEHHGLPGKSCSRCGLPYLPFPGDEETDIVEIEVKAYPPPNLSQTLS
jgi:hypothetical protein